MTCCVCFKIFLPGRRLLSVSAWLHHQPSASLYHHPIPTSNSEKRMSEVLQISLEPSDDGKLVLTLLECHHTITAKKVQMKRKKKKKKNGIKEKDEEEGGEEEDNRNINQE